MPGEANGRSWLAELDLQLADPASSGVVSIEGDRSELSSLARHLLRRARLPGADASAPSRRVLWAGGRGWADPYRELAFYLGVDSFGDCDEVATAIADAAADAILILEHPRNDPFSPGGTALAHALLERLDQTFAASPGEGSPSRGLWLLLSPPRSIGRSVEIGGCLSDDDVRRFCVSMIESSNTPRAATSLSSLEAWWAASVRQTSPSVAPRLRAAPSPGSAIVERRLRLLGRSCPADQLPRLAAGIDGGLTAAWAELVDAGHAEIDERGYFAPVGEGEPDAADAVTHEDHLIAAAVLEAMDDPLSLLRAALLSSRAGEWDRAEATIMRALSSATDRSCRTAILDAWSQVVEGCRGDDATSDHAREVGPRLLRSADVALRQGDPELALGLARRALAAGASRLDGRVIEARAAMENGDLSAASAALDLALEVTTTDAERARARAHQGELSVLCGHLDEAIEHASFAKQHAASEQVKLTARNVAGKVLLSRGDWSAAERHFAADESTAAGTGDLEAELRARLNRAIALLSSGRRDEAIVVLESVERDANRRGMLRAVAFAQANLATAATLAHDYGGALRRWEEAIVAVRAAGDRPKLARLIANLAELRVRLGLLPEAEEALAFGRRACRAGLSQPLASLLSFVAAKLRLAQGRTLLAASEVESAIAAARASSNGAKLGECHRLAARIAVEDGDLSRATASLEAAREAAGGPDAEAELTLIDGMILRSRGEPYEAIADKGLALALGSRDPELSRQAHLLKFHAACERRDDAAAASHLTSAKRLRDEMATSLTDAVRARFLARPDLAALDGLEANLALPAEGRPSSPGRPASSMTPPPSSGRRGARRAPIMVGETTPMKALAASIGKVGPSEVAVLISGESGTGKELVADAVHRASGRRDGPLVKVNCAALVETLLLSELFGHEKGAFTGASSRHLGRFEEARGGTLFLDEIGDISPRTQVALLRVLQDGTYYRVGGTTPLRADVRVICATHRDLRAMVERGEFRQDLYYRLCGVTLEVPALRERLGDLPLLCAESLARIANERTAVPQRLSEGALCALRRHGWPGNVRELDNALRSASLFADGEVITLDDLVKNVESLRYLSEDVVLAGLDAHSYSPEGRSSSSFPPPALAPRTAGSAASSLDVVYRNVLEGTSLPEMRRQLELGCILRALSESDGNVTRAAKRLGMKRPRLSQLIHQHGLKTKVGGAA